MSEGIAWEWPALARHVGVGAPDDGTPRSSSSSAPTLTLLGLYDEARRLYDAARVHADRAGLPWPSMAGTAALLERARTGAPNEQGRVGDDVTRLTVRDLLHTLQDRTRT